MSDFGDLNLVGQSPAFLYVLELTRKFAACDATVLLQGETGTGKELVARAVHYLSVRYRTQVGLPVTQRQSANATGKSRVL